MTARVPEHASTPGYELNQLLRRCPAAPEPKTWRFEGPSVGGEGWFVAFVDSNGYVALQSDYGNYAYSWWRGSLPEDTVLQFLVKAGVDYLMGKMARATWLDLEASKREAGEILVEARREVGRAHSHEEKRQAEEIREAWDALASVSDDHDWTAFLMEHGSVADCELWRCEVRNYSPQVRAFFEKTWPRIVERMRAEVERGELGSNV